MIVKHITTTMHRHSSDSDTKTEKPESKLQRPAPSSQPRKTTHQRASSSFMIEDILGSKQITRSISLPDTSRQVKDRPIQSIPDHRDNSDTSRQVKDRPIRSISDLQDNSDTSQQGKDRPIRSIPDLRDSSDTSLRHPVKPTPMVLSPLCSGFMNFGLYSPVGLSPPAYFHNQGHSVFSFPPNDLMTPIDNGVFSLRNGQVVRSAMLHASNRMEFGNAIHKSSSAIISQGSIVTIPNRHSGKLAFLYTITIQIVSKRNT